MDSDQRCATGADVTVPSTVNGLAEQGTTAFQAQLVPAPASDRSLAGEEQQELSIAGAGATAAPEAAVRDRAAFPAPADISAADTAGSKGAGAATSLFARLVARNLGQTSATDRVDSDQRGAGALGADVAVPSAVDGLAEQGTTAFQALLVPAPASDRPLAGKGQQEVGDAYGGQHLTVGASGGLSGGRTGFRSIRDQDSKLAVAVRPGETAGESQAAPVSSSAGAGAAAAPEAAVQERGALPAPADISAADTATSLFARLVARSLGQTSATDRVDSDQRGAGALGADVTVPSAVDGLAKQGTTAFQALLVPAPASGRPLAGKGQQEVGDAYGGQHPTVGASGGLSGGRAGFRSIRDQDPNLAVGVRPGEAAGESQAAPPVSSSAGAGAAAVREGANQDHAAPLAPANLFAADAAGQAFATKPEAGGAAREIQLDLRNADARVNVRLVERAGSVQVDVRTPDSHLAGSLRDDLPALTARLEQTGLRAETWHDAPAAAAARIRMAEPASSAAFQSSQNQSRREGGGHNPRDGQPQEKRQNQHQPESQTQPKEFSWLYKSLE